MLSLAKHKVYKSGIREYFRKCQRPGFLALTIFLHPNHTLDKSYIPQVYQEMEQSSVDFKIVAFLILLGFVPQLWFLATELDVVENFA